MSRKMPRTSYQEEDKLFRYKIQLEIITNHAICGFEEPLVESKFPIFNRKIIESNEIEIINK